MVQTDRGEELDVKKLAVLQLLDKIKKDKTAEEAVHALEESLTNVNAEKAPRNVAIADELCSDEAYDSELNATIEEKAKN